MKLSCSAYQAGCSNAQKMLSGHSGHMTNYGATSSTAATTTGDSTYPLKMPTWKVEEIEGKGSPNDNSESPNEGTSFQGGGSHSKTAGGQAHSSTGHTGEGSRHTSVSSHSDGPPDRHSDSTSKTHDSSRSPSESPANRLEQSRSRSKSVGEQQWTNLRAVMAWYGRLRRIKRSRSNQRWMKLRTTVQLSSAITSTIQKKTTLKREDSFLKRFSTRQVPEQQYNGIQTDDLLGTRFCIETFELGEEDGVGGSGQTKIRRKKKRSLPRSVVNPDSNFYFYWLMILTFCVLYNLWTLIVRESFPELQEEAQVFWIMADAFTDIIFILDMAVQFRTGYLEQGLMVYKTKKLAKHYVESRPFKLDLIALLPTDLIQFWTGTHPMFRVPRFLKIYRIYNYYYMVESRTVYPNVWRVVNLIHILLLLAHWFGCFYYLLSEAENFDGPWSYPDPKHPNLKAFASLTRKYLGSLYWSTLTLTTIGDLPTPYSNWQYLFTIVSYLIGVFIFATIVGQVGNVITNRNANRLEFERLLDGAKMYMRHHKVPRDMQRRVLRWYDYSWSRGRIQGGGDINTALGLLPDKLKTELALHVNLSVLKKVTIFQECQPEFLHDLVLKMKAYIFTPGDLICRKGEVAREMFIIADGILEVISEQGRVLTTMQAGDFFGEIGILNLDGLNKRTADVRSVGYSELFSLSREDVLAAMKDYPEAQEILQTLGRKRLMEARKAAGPALPKKTDKKSSPLHLLGHSFHKGTDESGGGDTTGKRIVEKLRSDVKGLRNAIRRSRKSNSSKEDSSEPESGKEPTVARRKESSVSMYHYGRAASIGGGVLPILGTGAVTTRGVLKRMHHVVVSDEKDNKGSSLDPSSPFGISKQSPSMLPKRVQVQLPPSEEMYQRRHTHGPGHSETAGAGSSGPGVIGAGLPLIQRLRLLKQKEERERRLKIEELKETAGPEPNKADKPTLVLTNASIEAQPSSKKEDGEPLAVGSSLEGVPELTPTLSPQRLSVESRGTSNESSTADSHSSTGTGPPIGSQIPSDYKRPSALHFQKNAKTYGSVDDLSPEFSRLPFIKKLKILNERQKIAELLTTKQTNTVLTRSTSEGSSEIIPPFAIPRDEQNLHSLLMGRRTQSSSEQFRHQQLAQKQLLRLEGLSGKKEPPKTSIIRLPFPSLSSSSSSSSSSSDTEEGAAAFGPGGKSKKVVKSSPSAIAESSRSVVCLPRESASATSDNEKRPGLPRSLSPPSPPYSPESNETPERRHLKSILKRLAQSASASASTSLVSIPRGETSIKSKSDDEEEFPPPKASSQDSTAMEDPQLLRAPTLEGFAARHRKFTKNVTFQRRAVTVVSPDNLPYPMSSPHPPTLTSSLDLPSCPQAQAEGEDSDSTLVPILDDAQEGDPGSPTFQSQLHPITLENMKTRISGLVLMRNGDEGADHPLSGIGLNRGLGVAQEECIGGVFLGIKNIIQAKMDEMQLKFQERFCTLEREVRKRDEIISVLQLRIQELEDLSHGHLPSSLRHKLAGAAAGNLNHQYEDEDYNEEDLDLHLSRHPLQSSYLFGRGDSIDTVIGNQDDLDDDDVDDEVFSPPEEESHLSSAKSEGQEDVQDGDLENESSVKTYPLWQLEFHRESFSATAAPPQPPSSNVDSVTVEIGSSTEYESSSSSEDEQSKKLQLTRPVSEIPVEETDSENSEEEDGPLGPGEQEMESDVEDDELQVSNQNWEVQMLAKEMEKMEDKKTAQVIMEEEEEEVVGEMLELEREIEEMRDVVSSGRLSPSELDMLESVLESRNKRVKDLGKAFSTELDGSPGRGLTTKSKKVGRSVDDFHSRARTNRVGSLQLSHLQQHGSTTLFCRKNAKTAIKRQASLCETGSSKPAKHEAPRRESAGSLAKFPSSEPSGTTNTTSGRSFLSRFSFMRTLSRTLIHQPNEPGPQDSGESSIPLQVLPSTTMSSSGGHFHTPGCIRPIISTISSALSPSGSRSTESGSTSFSTPATSERIFTIPSVPVVDQSQASVTSSPDIHHQNVGESQPLLKK